MSYKITLRIYQTNTNAFFRVVEQTVWNYANGGTWSDIDGQKVLTMGGSGTSGTIRFQSDTGENFLVIVGVHNYKPWYDIAPDLKNDETGTVINPEYYGSGVRNNGIQRDNVKNAQGRNLAIKFTVGEGNDLKANIIIG